MRAPSTVGAALIGGVAAVVLAGGVASAVVHAHTDPRAALPPICRDNPGSTGGALPAGAKLQQDLGQFGNGSAGASAAQSLASQGQLGVGTAQQLQLRAQALLGGGLDSTVQTTSQTSAGGGQSPVRQGDSGGSGAGSGGSGGTGSGGLSGGAVGTSGGSGSAPVAGQGPDLIGIPQQPQPRIVPPPVPKPTPPPAHHRPRLSVGGVALLVAALVLLVGLAVLALRRTKSRQRDLPDGTGLAPTDADALAANAVAAGDLDLALRWTFVSGLLRLDEVGVLPYDATRTTSDCAHWVRSAQFPVIAAGFDLVAYGGRHATLADLEAARSGWNALISEVSQRTDRARDVAVHGPLAASQR